MTRLLSFARPCLFAGSTALVACSPAVWRPLETTAAATELSQVTLSSDNELDPAVSPDARSIAFEVAPTLDALPHIAVMSLPRERSGGTGTIEYSSGQVLGRDPTWMPD